MMGAVSNEKIVTMIAMSQKRHNSGGARFVTLLDITPIVRDCPRYCFKKSMQSTTFEYFDHKRGLHINTKRQQFDRQSKVILALYAAG